VRRGMDGAPSPNVHCKSPHGSHRVRLPFAQSALR
jgi:hypothetical protein